MLVNCVKLKSNSKDIFYKDSRVILMNTILVNRVQFKLREELSGVDFCEYTLNNWSNKKYPHGGSKLVGFLSLVHAIKCIVLSA